MHFFFFLCGLDLWLLQFQLKPVAEFLFKKIQCGERLACSGDQSLRVQST